MKHLTTYKLFEAYTGGGSFVDDDAVYDYVNDLFAEIKSSGVRIFTASHFPSRYRVIIGEYSDQRAFSYSEVSDEIGHMISYFINECGMRLGDVDITFTKGSSSIMPNRLLGWEKLKQLETMKDEKFIFSLTINFMGRGNSTILESSDEEEELETTMTLKDICRDLEDDGWNISFSNKFNEKYYVTLVIKKEISQVYSRYSPEAVFKLGDVIDTTNRIIDYLGNKLATVQVCTTDGYYDPDRQGKLTGVWSKPSTEKILSDKDVTELDCLGVRFDYIPHDNQISESLSDEEADGREDSITNDIMDMSLDVQDEGLKVENEGYEQWRKSLDPNTYFIIRVTKPANYGTQPFYIDKIEDFLFRVYEYGKVNPCDIEMAVGFVKQGHHKLSKLLIRDNGDMSVMFQTDNYLLDNKIQCVEIRVKVHR